MNPLDLPFSRTAHDRAAHRRAEPGLVERLRADPTTGVLVVHRGRLAAVGRDTPRAALLPAPGQPDGLWL